MGENVSYQTYFVKLDSLSITDETYVFGLFNTIEEILGRYTSFLNR